MPDDIVNAAIASEDRTFWTNDGVDYPAIMRAGFANLEAGEVVQGASTITQQVIKYAGSIKSAEEAQAQPTGSAAPSLELDPDAGGAEGEQEVCQPPRLTFLESDRKLWDKVQEAVMARKVTETYETQLGLRGAKEKILETYLNLIFYGNGSYGIKAAAANYFGIANLDDLTLSQSAFLAGLPQLPSAYDPYFNDQGPEPAIQRRNDVLQAMHRRGLHHRQAAPPGAAHDLGADEAEPHHFGPARTALQLPRAARGRGDPGRAGRRRTRPRRYAPAGIGSPRTLDYELQQVAHEQVVAWVNALADKNVHNGALVAIDSATGEIVAYVGSVDYYNRKDKRVKGQFDVAGLSVRQPGSAFKPIVYSSAFRAREATPATFFVDAVTQFGADRETSYLPTNADIKDHGPLLAVDALRYSLNVPSVMMQYLVGVNETAAFAESMGIATSEYILDQDPGTVAGASDRCRST